MKQCSKDDCINDAIPRGKYCEAHRKKKRKVDENDARLKEEEELNQILINRLLQEDNETPMQYQEREQLKAQQDEDYLEAMKIDMENLRLKQVEITRKTKIRQKFQDFQPDLSDIMLQFTFPENRFRIKQEFHTNCVLRELFEFIDIIIEDNNFKIPQYQLVVYPSTIFTRYSVDIEKVLEDVDIKHGLSLFVQRIDML
jgi:hypothetical protein